MTRCISLGLTLAHAQARQLAPPPGAFPFPVPLDGSRLDAALLIAYIVDMPPAADAGSSLGEFEMIVLLAVLQAGEGAYGVPIQREIEGRTGRPVARGAVYVTLDRLERKGLLSSSLADPTPERGGRAKRVYRLEPRGLAALRSSLQALARMQQGLDLLPESP